MIRLGVLTVSDACSRGEREDLSGAAITAWASARGYETVARSVVPDEVARITPLLLSWCDEMDLDLVVSTGGTGVAPRDVTPEATRAVIERDVPGLAEQLRRCGLESTPYAALSRGMVGVRGRTLLVNLPGSPGGVRDGLGVLDGVVEHACALLRGQEAPHVPPGQGGAS